MQFRHPELLWALLLLLIPIFIHLFQLRRFKKTPFTNVKVLKRVQSESRKSSTLKKWLLLLSRLLLLAALIFAFARPFFAAKTALKKKETVIYLDDSFSTQAKSENATLFENAVQDLMKSIPVGENFSLFTNEKTYSAVTVQDIQNDLLTLEHSAKQLRLDEILLKANTFFGTDESTEKNLILVSDFQQRMAATEIDTSNAVRKHLVQLREPDLVNVAVDSVFLEDVASENIELTALLSSKGRIENIPVSLFNTDKLIAKTSATFDENGNASVRFTVPANERIEGIVEISDTGLPYDNKLYFNIDKKEKIKVMSIGPADANFLERIFNPDEFIYGNFGLQNLDYARIADQHTILLNELPSIPNALTTSLKSFSDEGGSVIVIPSTDSDFDSYNTFLMNVMGTSFTQKIELERNITNINFDHSLYRDVFEKNVTNFQYPKVSRHYRIKTSLPQALTLQDNSPLLVGSGGKYLFTAALNTDNSNFKNSPLIVPTLYNMAASSLKLPELYRQIGSDSGIDIPIKLSKDEIVKVSKSGYEFIPLQRSLANKVNLSFQENDIPDGIYQILNDEKPVMNISFNYPRDESQLNYLDLATIHAQSNQTSLVSLFDDMQKDNAINELWKWFVILALLFLLVEILIQKYL
ncbi:BatA domain-containing protein [Maribacter algicola]|uniref:BatA domain-containing protein n=1 Tax=Meishania litoralis TaxID=3434685 RepID=A0ACC7LM12_9FLAO